VRVIRGVGERPNKEAAVMNLEDALALDVHRRRQADASMAHRVAAARRSADTQVDDRAAAARSDRRVVVRASGWLRGLVGTLSGRGATPIVSTLRRA
jgi:hypothetical protein